MPHVASVSWRVLRDPRGLLAAHDVDEVPGAEPLVALALEPHDRREQLLRGHRAVPALGRREAGVAVAARLGSLPEVAEQVDPAALHGLAEGEHRVEVRGELAAVREVAGRVVDHAALLHDVVQAVGEPGGRRQAVAAGATGLLVVALDRFGQVDVGDEAHVGLVDAHAEGDRGDDDHAVFAQEPRLRRRPRRRRRVPRGTAAP